MEGQGDKKKQERKLLEIYAPLKIRNCTTAVKLLLFISIGTGDTEIIFQTNL